MHCNHRCSKRIDHRLLEQVIRIFTCIGFPTHKNQPLENHQWNWQMIKATWAFVTATGSRLSLPFPLLIMKDNLHPLLEARRSPFQALMLMTAAWRGQWVVPSDAVQGMGTQLPGEAFVLPRKAAPLLVNEWRPATQAKKYLLNFQTNSWQPEESCYIYTVGWGKWLRHSWVSESV